MVKINYRFKDSDMAKLENMFTSLRIKCPKCGHSNFIPDFVSKKICNWCGIAIYNNNELGKKQKFKDEYLKAKKKVERDADI